MPHSGDQHVRITSLDGAYWIELAQLRPPGATGKPRRDAGGDFWGSVTLHTPDDHIRAYVGWNEAYTHWFATYLSEIGGWPNGWSGEKSHRTEDDDLIIAVSFDGSAPASITARVLDWWDPYHPSKSGYQYRRELSATFAVDYGDLESFARRAVRMLGNG